MTQSIHTASAWPEPKTVPAGSSHKAAVAALMLGAVVATLVFVPTASFRAKAVVAVVDAGSPLAPFLSRNAGEAAVSNKVMTRAAESLVGTGFQAPEPDLAERAALAAHLGGTKATGKVARLAAALPGLVSARPGEMPGTLDILASGADGERAVQMAASVADALIVAQDDVIAMARHKRESDAAARIERLKADAAKARLQFAALGGEEADPAQALATAAAQTAKAQIRVDTIRAINASGNPPLSDRRDVPSAIETLQAAYLDLARQLAKARETLGDRHTTIIALDAELRHAAASLKAEWRRLGRMAEADLAAARERETRLRKADTGGGAARRTTIDDARRKIQFADEALGRTLAAIREPAADEQGYRLVMRPMVPNAATGLSFVSRLLFAGLAGFSMLGLALLFAGWRRTRPVLAQTATFEPVIVARSSSGDEADDGDADHVDLTRAPIEPAQPLRAGRRDRNREPLEETPPAASTSDVSLLEAMTNILPQLEALAPAHGPVPTVMVASNEVTADVSPVALALARAAAGAGHRVLLVEATRSRQEIAAAADSDAEPLLVDFFGTLRVVLRAADGDGALFLAPNLQQGARIASALARQGCTALVDDIGAEFDLVMIDGGRSTDAAAAGWGADAYLRVGRHRSKRDDDLFAAAFGVSRETILGAVVGSVFADAAIEPVVATARPVAPVGRAAYRAGPASNLASSSGPNSASNPASSAIRQAPPRRRIGAR